MKFFDAVKLWNAKQDNGKWCVPRKGTKEHAEVMAMMKPEVKSPVKPSPSVKPGPKPEPKNEIIAPTKRQELFTIQDLEKTLQKPPNELNKLFGNSLRTIEVSYNYFKSIKNSLEYAMDISNWKAMKTQDKKDICDALSYAFNISTRALQFDKKLPDDISVILRLAYNKLNIDIQDVEHIMNYWNKWCKVKDKSKDMYKNVLTPREKSAIDKEKTINELKEKQKKGTITYEEDQDLQFLERKPEKTYKRSDREAYGVDGLLRKAKEGIAKYKDINEWKKLTSEEKQAVCRYIFLVSAAHTGKKFESYYTADDIKEFKKLFSEYSNVIKESPHIVRYFKTHCGEYRDRMNGGRKLKETMIMKGGVINFNS